MPVRCQKPCFFEKPAIAMVTAVADSSLEDVDVELVADVLCFVETLHATSLHFIPLAYEVK